MNNELIKEVDLLIKDEIEKVNLIESFYSNKVLKAFKNNTI